MVAEYYYDPFGRRLWKEVGGTKTFFYYSDEGLVGEYDAAGNEIKTYGWQPNSIWSTDPLFMKQGGAYYYYRNDHLGTPMQMTDSDGLVVWEAKYDAFGNATVAAGSTITNNLRFPGQYFDAETGLHYNWNRYYSPETGRYLRVDPLGVVPYGPNGGVNHLYIYALNNPLSYIDPLGLVNLGKVVTGALSVTDGMTMIGVSYAGTVATFMGTGGNPVLTGLVGTLLTPMAATGVYDIWHGAHLFWEGITEDSESEEFMEFKCHE